MQTASAEKQKAPANEATPMVGEEAPRDPSIEKRV